MLEDIVEQDLNAIATWLGETDSKTIRAARLILSGGLPSADNLIKPYKSKSLKIQEELINLKSRLFYALRSQQLILKRMEGELIESGEVEGVRNREERICMMLTRDNRYFDQSLTVQKLETAYNLTDELFWALKNAFGSA